MGVPAEIIQTTMCPGCYNEGKADNPLKNVAGFNATYCTSSDGFTKQHVYDDTGILRVEIQAMKKKVTLAKKREKDAEGSKPPDPTQTEPAASPEGEDAPLSINEPKAFSVSEMDSERLADLLGQPIGDSGTLVGAVYAMKNTTVEMAEQQNRQSAAREPLSVEIPQRSDGNLALQVFLPWKLAKQLFDKANFNGVSAKDFAQALFENLASGNFFGGSDVPDYPPVDPREDGIWILLEIPEMYVATTLDRTTAFGSTPQKYLQDFIYLQVANEVFP